MTVRNQGGAPRYSETKLGAAHFVTKIQKLLGEYGADGFMVELSEGQPVAIAYQLGGLAYRLRPNVEAMAERLEKSRKGRAKPAAVAWAQACHLLELQLEAIETGAARASEVLGGYVLTAAGRTVGDMIEERGPELLPGESLLLPTRASG